MKEDYSRLCQKCTELLYYSSLKNLQQVIESGRPCITCIVQEKETT